MQISDVHPASPQRRAAPRSRTPPGLTPINIVATRLGVSARALRHYESIGLVAARRGVGAKRCYDDDTVRVLEAISRLRSVDVPLAEIRAALSQRAEPQAYVDALRAILTQALAARREAVRAVEALLQGLDSNFVLGPPETTI